MMVRKSKLGYLIILTVGLLAVNMPLSAQAKEIAAETEVKVPVEEEERELEKKTVPESVSPDSESSEEPEIQKEVKKVKERAVSPQADDSDKSAGLVFEWLSQVPTEEKVYTAGGGQITWTPVLEGGKVVSGTVRLENAVIDSTGMGINFPVPIDIQVEGENQITSKGIGIYLADGATGNALDLRITGSGFLKINSQGNGIQTQGDIAVDTVRLEIMYGAQGTSGSGLFSQGGDVVVKDCDYVKVKNNPGIGNSNGAVRSSQAGNGTIRIENSHAIIINDSGEALSAIVGKIELISSDVRAIGKTSDASGVLAFNQCTVDGGTLFAQNTGEGGLEIPSVWSRPLVGSNSAVIYGAQDRSRLPLEGDIVWYIGCSYDEDADKVAVPGGGFVFGDVVWNDNMRLGEGKAISVGRYSTTASSLTIPEDTTVDMPAGSKINVVYSDSNTKSSLIIDGTLNVTEGCTINNNSNSTLINNGTVNVKDQAEVWNMPDAAFINNGVLAVQDGGKCYNAYSTASSAGGTFQNKGEINISETGIFQNQNRLENSGIINTTGNFSTIKTTGYPSTVDNNGEINGFLIERHDDSYVNIANGKTVLKQGQTLTLGAGVAGSGAMSRILKVQDGAELIIEEGAVVDAKTHVTEDTVADFIDLSDKMVVNGELWLPDNTSGEVLDKIADNITGNGTVQSGSAKKYIVTISIGEELKTQLIEQGGTVTLPKDPFRDGYNFGGWYVADGDDFKAYDGQSQIQQSIKILSKWFAVNEWAEPLTIESWSYGAKTNKPKATPKYGEKVTYTYSSSADGEFTDTVPEDAGTWYVKAAVEAFEEGLGGWTSLESNPVSFKIAPKTYEDGGSITVSEIKSEEDIKNIVIKDGEKVLTENEDYTVSTSEDDKKVTITITFKGNYDGTVEKKWEKPEPDTPDKPDTPDQPDTPDTPDAPDTPDQPDTPDVPENPGGSETPESKPDITKATAALNANAKAAPSGGRLKITWGKVSQADGYDIYAEKCGKKAKLVKSIKGSQKTSFSIIKIGKKKVSPKASYKTQIRAYRIVNGKKEIIAKSLTLHTAGENQKGYTNARSLKVSKAKLTLKKGAVKKFAVSTVKQNSKKKLFPKSHIAPYRYYSTDGSVASVSKNGTIKGKKKGSCTVYAVAANGVKKGIKVTVK